MILKKWKQILFLEFSGSYCRHPWTNENKIIPFTTGMWGWHLHTDKVKSSHGRPREGRNFVFVFFPKNTSYLEEYLLSRFSEGGSCLHQSFHCCDRYLRLSPYGFRCYNQQFIRSFGAFGETALMAETLLFMSKERKRVKNQEFIIPLKGNSQVPKDCPLGSTPLRFHHLSITGHWRSHL